MHETDLDPRALDWLRDGPAGASDWVLESAVHHARRHPRRRSLRAGWSDAMKAMTLGHPATPALRLILAAGLTTLAVAAGGLFYAGSQGLLVGPTPTPSATPTPSPTPTPVAHIDSLPTELQGTWSGGSTTVILGPCAIGEECGRLERIDDNREHCLYRLAYRSGDAEGFTLETGLGNSFGCAWSPWSKGVVHLTPSADGSLEVWPGAVVQDAVTLWPVAAGSPIPTPTPEPSASQAGPDAVIDDMLEAWRWGRTSAIGELYAADHTVLVLGNTARLDSGRHFEIRPGNRGYVYWEPRGRILEAGDYVTQPMVAGVWDPGTHGLVVFRFDPQDRIEVEWAVVRPTTWTSSHEEVRAGPATFQHTTIIDRCVGMLDAGDRAGYLACYAPGGESRISADQPGGAWTETHIGLDAIATGLDGSVYQGIERTGDMIEIGDIVAYPFRGTSRECRAGIDVLELDAGYDRIINHWAFCGPE